MSFIGDAIGDVFGGITGASQAADAAEAAGRTQSAASQAGIDEQRRQFDTFVELMAPYLTAGQGALSGQQALIGLQGQEAQQQAISGFEQSPFFQSLTQQGENAILQNASATGGLRGGNTQAALAQFRPQILNALIEQQYGRLGGLSTLGQASAAGQASAGMQLGQNVSGLLGQQGAATAGGQLAQGGVVGNTFGTLAQLAGAAYGAGAFGGGGAGAGMGAGGGPVSYSLGGGTGASFGGGGSGLRFTGF
jgi:hypothetical protein